jgi:hypothetical protein
MLTRQPAYNAVYEVIRHHPGTAEQNGVIWRAVEAALDAMGVPPNSPSDRIEMTDTDSITNAIRAVLEEHDAL